MSKDKNKENDKTGDRIKTIRGEIKTRERENSELQGEIRALEDSFIQTAKRCKIEWYRPKWMGSKTTNKLNDLKYWTS